MFGAIFLILVAISADILPVVKSVVIDEVVNLQLGGAAYDKINYYNIPMGSTMRWKFTTSPGARISLYCNQLFLGNTCLEGNMKANIGNIWQIFCSTYLSSPIVSSISNTLTLIINELKRNDGTADCLVQAINGSDYFQFKNMDIKDLDSSEYGQTPGAKTTDCDCGWSRRNSGGRIVGGSDAAKGEYPWLVSIQYNGIHWCGGSIITEYHILTAAHCVVGQKVEECKVITGTINNTYSQDGQVIAAKQLIYNNQYNSTLLFLNDIAIIYLQEKIKFSDKVGRVCMSPKALKSNNQVITVMGWGSLGPAENMRSPQILQKAHVRVVDYITCSFMWYHGLDTSTEDRVCVWGDGRTACYGDSGGPLVWLDPETNRYTQIALVSFGHKQCFNFLPQVNTNTGYFYTWIQNTIAATQPSQTCKKIN